MEIDELVEVCFNDGGTYLDPSGIVCDIAVLRVAMLSLPTGRLGIVDPAYNLDSFDDAALICADLGRGEFAFDAAVFRPRRADGTRLRSLIAAVRIGTPTEGVWTPAWERAGSPLGVSIDGGAVAVFDVAGRSNFPLPVDEGTSETSWVETVLDRGFVVPEVDPLTGGLVIYQSSLGDGAYTPWIQQDSAGRPRCVVVDMQVID